MKILLFGKILNDAEMNLLYRRLIRMYKNLLNNFFKKNKIESETPTAPAFANFFMRMEAYPESREKLSEVMHETILSEQPEREEELQAERNEILSSNSCDQIIQIMRRNTDMLNHQVLINKALEFDEIIPKIVKMLKTSLNAGFIETSVRVLAKSQQNVSEELIECFDDIRSPYAQSMVLVLLGFIADEKHIPWVIKKYELLKKLYPHENYCDGAFYGLDELDYRFYHQERKRK